ncbi:MAG: twin-arginine translocase subunit TatC [Nitrospinota bacterium]
MTDDKRMGLTGHLSELRRCIVISLIGVGVGFGAVWNFTDPVLAFLQGPIQPVQEKLVIIAPTEAFFTQLKVAFLAGFLLSLPLILHQVWSFVSPGLFQKERAFTFPFIVLSTLCFLIGAAFAFFVVMPFGIRFLVGYAGAAFTPSITIGNYISFTIRMLLVFGAVFELPLATFLLTRFGFLTPSTLSKNRRYAIVLMFVGAALLTPPDVFTQLLMAGPLLGLYEISIVTSRMALRQRELRQATSES